MTYVPILKGKAGELSALEHATPEVWSSMRPVVELVPNPELVRDLLETFSDRVMDAVPQGRVLTVDCGALPTSRVLEGDLGGPMARLTESLGLRKVLLCPVVRSTDSDEVLAEAADASAQHGCGACLRVPVPDGPLLQDEQIERLLDLLDVGPGDIDLLLDAGPVQTAATAERLADSTVRALSALSRWPWRRQCVAAGAFPVNLTGFPRGEATPVVRQEARLWQRVVERWQGGSSLEFGDFGVTHPRIPEPSRGTPDPNMRYTSDGTWQVFVYPRILPGNDDFFTLSHDLVSSPYWPPGGAGTSWGDARLLECATRQRPKAGGGTQWRAWATSHHLAVVTKRLNTQGCP